MITLKCFSGWLQGSNLAVFKSANMFWSETLCQSIQYHLYINFYLLWREISIENGGATASTHQNCWRLNRWQRGVLVQSDLRRSQGGIVFLVNHGRSPGLCLWLVLQCPSSPGRSQDLAWPCTNLTVHFLCTFPFSWSSSRPAGLFGPTFSKQEWDASHRNISFSPKISPG